jgi:hypothetical protein
MSQNDVLNTSDMQFGFKRNSSTTQCTFALLETIQYYLQRDSPVWCMFLDASQAFDNVQYVTLFRRLLQKKLCPRSCWILLKMHTGQAVCVRWGGITSPAFSVRNGVKQGGILSPVLFTLYVDILLEKLRSSNVGCHLGRTFCGALAYADDVALLAPTRSALKSMLTIAEKTGGDLHITFNSTKSQMLVFHPNLQFSGVAPINFGGAPVPESQEALHLGHLVGHDQKVPPRRCADDLTRRTNILCARFSHCTLAVKYRLFQAYCMSAYGSCLWNMGQAEPFLCAWRKCIRRLLHLPRTTHCHLLPSLVRDRTPEDQLCARLVRFIHDCSISQNSIIRRCHEEVRQGSCSAVSDSVTLLCTRYQMRRDSLPAALKVPRTEPCQTASALRDFMLLREENNDTSINCIIEYLATA